MIVFNRLKVSPGWSDKPLAFQEGLLVPQLRPICPDGEGRVIGKWLQKQTELKLKKIWFRIIFIQLTL